MRRIGLSLIGMLIGFSSFGQTIVTEAPSMTNSTYTLGAADFQIESRFEYSNSGITNTFLLPVNLFRIGLGKRFEFRTQNGLTYRTFNGFGSNTINFENLSLGAKYGIIGGSDKKFTLATIVDIDVPRYKSKINSGSIVLAASNTIKEKHAISYSLIYSLAANNWEFYNHHYRATLMYSTMLSKRIGVYGETYFDLHDSDFDPNDNSYFSFDVGFIYLLRDHIQLDYSFGTGIDHTTTYHALGFNILFPKK